MNQLKISSNGLLLLITLATFCIVTLSIIPKNTSAQAIENMEAGGGIFFYGNVLTGTESYFKTYSSSTDSFSATSTATTISAQPRQVVVKTSPLKAEVVAGYIDTSNNLNILCYDPSTRLWTLDFTVAVGANNTRRFDIAYESQSGRVVVLYSRGVATTNELGYTTKAHASSCGSANWANATSLDPVRTSGTVLWIKMATTATTSSNLIAAAWSDDAASPDLSSMIWNATANSGAGGWANEPASAHDTAMEIISAAGDVDNFDLAYESLSKDLIVFWGDSRGGSGTAGLSYRTCTGGTTSCTWNAVVDPAAPSDDVHYIQVANSFISDKVSVAAFGAGGDDFTGGYWNGTTYTGYSNLDATGVNVQAQFYNAVGATYLSYGSTERYVFTYSEATGIDYFTATPGSTPTVATDFDVVPAKTDGEIRMNFYQDPMGYHRGMYVSIDSDLTLSAQPISIDSGSTIAFRDLEGDPLTVLPTGSTNAASFAFWRFVPMPMVEYSGYRVFAETTGDTNVGSPLALQNTKATLATTSGAFRLRWLLRVRDSIASTSMSSFKIQYAESQAEGSCASIPTASYIDVGASTPIAFNNTAAADASTLTSNEEDPTPGSETVVAQKYLESNTFALTTDTPGGQNMKFDFSLKDNGAREDQLYCFRLTNNNSAVTVSASSTISGYGYPEVRTWSGVRGNSAGSAATEAGGSASPSSGGDIGQGGVRIFTSAGETSYVVPSGINFINAYAWGGGGGGGGGGTGGSGGNGAGGGFTKSTISVTPGETLTIRVGGGGGAGGGGASNTGGNGGSNGGGDGGNSHSLNTNQGAGGGGGGYSGVFRSSTPIIIAPGGGGGGGGDDGAGNGTSGGAGGGTVGTAGTNYSGSITGGGGGTQSEGGSAGGNCCGQAGSSLNGGDGSDRGPTGNQDVAGSGGGGGGYFGGGSGGGSEGLSSEAAAAGGGGSAYFLDGSTSDGSGTVPGGVTENWYGHLVGVGGSGGSVDSSGSGGNSGKVVLVPSSASDGSGFGTEVRGGSGLESWFTNANTGQTTISSNLTTYTDNAWIIETVSSGTVNQTFSPANSQTEEYESQVTSGLEAAGSRLSVASAGLQTVGWNLPSTPSRSVHVGASFAPSDGQTIGYDADTSSTGTNISTNTFSHTVASNSDRLLIVSIHAEDVSGRNSDCQVSSVSYAGQDMVEIDDINITNDSTTYNCASMWYLLSPTVGTNSVVINLAGSVNYHVSNAMSIYNVRQPTSVYQGGGDEASE